MSWHTVEEVAEDTYRIIEPLGSIVAGLEPGDFTVNTYLLIGQERAVLVDSGTGVGNLREVVSSVTSLACQVLNTHHHWDHVGANALFEESAIHEVEAIQLGREQPVFPALLWEALQTPAKPDVLPPSFDPGRYRVFPPSATRLLHDGDLIELGGRRLVALHTPGHSPGHTAYLDASGGMLFAGDTASRDSVFICFEGCDARAFARTTHRLALLPGPLTVCPGHNDVIREPGWLDWFAKCAQDAVTGRTEGTLWDTPIVGREFRFGGLSLWLAT